MFALFFASIVAVSISGDPSVGPKIAGGKNTQIKEHPYQVSLQYNGKHFCGGVIIGTEYVLTTAFCTDSAVAAKLSVRAGSSYHNRGGVVVRASKIHVHPKYNFFTGDYDLAVVKLKKKLTLGPSVRAVKLPKRNEKLPSATRCVASGWGFQKENGNYAKQLQEVNLPVYDWQKCRSVYKKLTDRMICTGSSGDKNNACWGDQGGPLVCKKLLYGVISNGFGCGRPNQPRINTNVASLKKFIDDIVGTC